MNPLPDSAPGRRAVVRRWGGTLLLFLTFVGMAMVSWRKWPDPIVDFGADLYIPWRIISGEHLYQGISWKNGPLSQYINALWFQLFGVSFSSLVYPNLVLIAILTWVIRSIFHRIISPAAGVTAAFVFLSLFAFAQHLALGNYNFICPYRHEQTHGLFFAVVGMYCLIRALEVRSGSWWFSTGVSVGFVFLTKIELTVAAAAGVGIGFALKQWLDGESRGTVWRDLGALAGGGLLPPVLAAALLSTRMPVATAISGTLGNWGYVFRTGVGEQVFFQRISGFDAPARSLAVLLIQFLTLAGVAVIGVLAEAAARRAGREGWPVMIGMAVLTAMVGYQWINWVQATHAFPLILGLMLVKTIRDGVRENHDPAVRDRLIGLAAWMFFAMALLGKILLAVQIIHYGFTLALPATLVIVAYVVHAIPKEIRRFPTATGRVFQATMIGLVGVAVLLYVGTSIMYYGGKTLTIGTGGDRMMIYGPAVTRKSRIFADALQGIQEMVPPEATLVVLPEGVMFNYLARRRSSLPYTLFTPYDVATFGGEGAMLETMKRRPPDFIALVDRDMREYGVGWFGSDPNYGKPTLDWIIPRYRAVRLDGALPLQEQGFGILLLQRKDPPSPAAVSSNGG